MTLAAWTGDFGGLGIRTELILFNGEIVDHVSFHF